MDDISIRPATHADVERLIAILYEEPPGEFRALVPDRRKARVIGAALIRNGLSLNIDRTAVAVAGGEAVGLIALQRPGESDRTSVAAVLRVVARAFPLIGPAGLWRYVLVDRARGRMRLAHPVDSLFVWELDVHPEWRNRGIGGVMLRWAEEIARSEGFPRMALTTTTTNPAQHLYSRHGYQIVDTRLDAEYERLIGTPGRVLMVKELA
jgi:ribosomal protein S18 acetylase RimI-like enzyme